DLREPETGPGEHLREPQRSRGEKPGSDISECGRVERDAGGR
ncbi:unnamed protein product, partial [Tenebrio molitor]